MAASADEERNETAGDRRDALRRCVGDAAYFGEQVWGRRAMVRGPGAEGFEDLLSLEDVDHLLSGYGLQTPAFRLVRDGRTLPSSQYTRSARIGGQSMSGIAHPARVFEAFEQGATIVLQGLQRYWPPLTDFCRDLELGLGHRCQVNAYITPPGSQGFHPHADTHDTFILQAFGHKEWRVWPVPGEDEADGDGDAATAVELQPGATVYMPTGTRHSAHTGQSLSGHLTVGIHPTRWRQVMEEALVRLLDDPALESPLPVGFHRAPDSVAAEVGDRADALRARLEKLDARQLADDLVAGFLTHRPSLLRGGLGDRVRLAELDDGTRVRRRAGAVCELRGLREGRLRVLLGDRELRVPAWVEPAMREIAWRDAREAFAVRDLAPQLDTTSRGVLVRRLVREGLLEVADG